MMLPPYGLLPLTSATSPKQESVSLFGAKRCTVWISCCPVSLFCTPAKEQSGEGHAHKSLCI